MKSPLRARKHPRKDSTALWALWWLLAREAAFCVLWTVPEFRRHGPTALRHYLTARPLDKIRARCAHVFRGTPAVRYYSP